MTDPTQTEVTGPKKGSLVFPDQNELVSAPVKGSTSLVVGDPITFDTNGYMLKAADTSTIADGLGVLVQEDADNTSGSDGDIVGQAAVGNTYVFFTLGGTVKQLSLVKLDSSNKAVAHTKPSNASAIYSSAETNAARDYFGKSFGRYFGHQREGEKTMTKGQTNEVVAIRLGL